MGRTVRTKLDPAAEKRSLRRRITAFYKRFNASDWQGCFATVDPRLTEADQVRLESYSSQLKAFKERYGSVDLFHARFKFHLDVSPKQSDKRPFAFAYLFWEDARGEFHAFRERWVKEGEGWFTRVAGLVAARPAKD